METSAHHATEHSARKTQRKDPAGFVLVIVLALFAVTAMAVVTMQLANEFNWQVL